MSNPRSLLVSTKFRMIICPRLVMHAASSGRDFSSWISWCWLIDWFIHSMLVLWLTKDESSASDRDGLNYRTSFKRLLLWLFDHTWKFPGMSSTFSLDVFQELVWCAWWGNESTGAPPDILLNSNVHSKNMISFMHLGEFLTYRRRQETASEFHGINESMIRRMKACRREDSLLFFYLSSPAMNWH